YPRALGVSVGDDEARVLAQAPAGVLMRADAAPLQLGDVILAVGTTEVATPWALQRAMLQAPTGTLLRVWRAGTVLRLPLPGGVERGVARPAQGAGHHGLADVDREE